MTKTKEISVTKNKQNETINGPGSTVGLDAGQLKAAQASIGMPLLTGDTQILSPEKGVIATGFRDDLIGTGTREWAEHSFNICVGCSHNCWYCYARSMALRFGRVSSCSDWANVVVLPDKVAAASRKFSGSVMFPTTHDITPELIKPALRTLHNLFAARNSVLFVTKPHLSVIQTICREMVAYRDRLQFRFTIGSGDAATCALWEPGAPTPEERISALRYAFEQGYETSVSMEPMLSDNESMCSLVGRVEPFVSGTIWLGKLNGGILQEIQAKPGIQESLRTIRSGQSDECILQLHDRLAPNPKVRWKDSIKKVLRLRGRSPQQSTTVPSADLSPVVSDAVKAKRSDAAKKAWETMRRRYTPEQIRSRAQAAATKASETIRAKTQ